jgi:hypothetical protein
MKTATDFIRRNLKSRTAIGFLLLLTLAFQPVYAHTDHMFFFINGDSTATYMVQGDNVAWGANCDTLASITWEIWVDLNANGVIDPSTDMSLTSFTSTDGDTVGNQGLPDFNPIPDGYCITPPMILGVAPAHYIFRATESTDNSTVQEALLSHPLLSPPNMFCGKVFLDGHPAPDSIHLRNIWISADLDHGGSQMWSALTNDSGFFQINVSDQGTGIQFYIKPMDIPGFVTPIAQSWVASGVINNINFTYTMPTDSLYGTVRDEHGTPLTLPVRVYCSPPMGGNGRDVQAVNGHYAIFFGPADFGQWSAGVSSDNLIPYYLYPNSFNFDNTIVHTQSHDFTCYTADTVLYARLTENGASPTHEYMIQAQSSVLECATNAVSGMGASNLVALHISSLDASGWNINISNWDNRYPIPPGYVLDNRNQTWNRHPGDTVGLNFIYGKMVRDTLKLDEGDPPINWNNLWVNIGNNGSYFNAQPENNGVYTIYADTGYYSLTVNMRGYLSDPQNRWIHLLNDTTGGLGFVINQSHCRISGTLLNVPLPLHMFGSLNAHTGTDGAGYATWTDVDTMTGAYTLWVCDGDWQIDPPIVPERMSPTPIHITILESPDTVRALDITYLNPDAVNDPVNQLPQDFVIYQNFPNPFNAETSIEYGIPNDSKVTVEVYDLLGRKLETLVDKNQSSGYFKVTWNAGSHPSGVYFYRISANDVVQTRKMLLLK